MATSVGERVGGEFSVEGFVNEMKYFLEEVESNCILSTEPLPKLTPDDQLFFERYYPLFKDVFYRTQAKGIMESYIQD